MKTIRWGLFETNSSSTHSVTIFSDVEFQKFKDGEFLIDAGGKLVPATQENKDDEEVKDYEQFAGNEYEETDITKHTTSSGDKIVVVCRYGS